MHKTINHMVSRRNFIKAAGATAAGLAISSLEGPEALASTAESYSRIPGANSKVNVALVGIGFNSYMLPYIGSVFTQNLAFAHKLIILRINRNSFICARTEHYLCAAVSFR